MPRIKSKHPVEPLAQAPETTGSGAAPEQPEPAKSADTSAPETARTDAEEKAWIAERVAKLSEMLRTAITDGDVLPSIGEVRISKDASPTKVAASREYLKLEAQTGKGMAAMNGGRIKPALPKPAKDAKDERTPEQKLPGACDFHNYGADLDVRAAIRSELMQSLEGPEKAIVAAVKSMRGIDWSDADIKSHLLKVEKFKVHPGLEAIIDAALSSK